MERDEELIFTAVFEALSRRMVILTKPPKQISRTYTYTHAIYIYILDIDGEWNIDR